MFQFFSRSYGKFSRSVSGRSSFRSRAKAIPESGVHRSASHPYAAVAIQPGLIACRKVEMYVGKRMLEKHAPLLPVPGCDVRKCSCRYRKFKDRRSGEERRVPFADPQYSRFARGSMVERQTRDRRKRPHNTGPRSYFNDYD